MSGILAAINLGAQNPVLKGGLKSFNVPTAGARAALLIERNGTMFANFEGGTLQQFVGDWGGPVPTSTQGDSYEVRVTHVSGPSSLGDPEFQVLNTWYQLNVGRQFSTGSVGVAGQQTTVSKVEIRRFGGSGQILATGNYSLSFFRT